MLRLPHRLIVWLLLPVIGVSRPTGAAPAPRVILRVILVVVPELSADDLTRPELAGLQALLPQGAAGWMVCRAALPPGATPPANGHDPQSALLLTLGAGSRAATPTRQGGGGLRSRERPAGELQAIPPALLTSLLSTNRRLDHTVVIGALGQLFHDAGLQTAVLSDAFTETEALDGLLLAMDRNGEVDYAGPRLACLLPSQDAPYGLRTDVAALLDRYRRLPSQVGLAVLVPHDLQRAARYAPLCLPDRAEALRGHALRDIATLLAALHNSNYASEFTSRLHGIGNRTLLILCAPGSPFTSDRTDRSAPVVLWGDGFAPGTLTSPSTRRTGLVVNTDLLPTLATFLQRPIPSSMVGRPMVSRGGAPPSASDLLHQHDHLANTARLQVLYGGLPALQLALVLCGAGAILARHRPVAGALACLMVALPLGMLILPPLAGGNPLRAGLLLGLFALAAGGSALGWFRAQGTAAPVFYALCAALALLIPADLISGMHLLRDAWMSYSVMEGARYYGIGNEYMGAVIGASCALFPAITTWGIRTGRGAWILPLLCLLYGLTLIVMGLPSFGAKVGAIPSAACGYGTLLLVWRHGRLRLREVAPALGATALLLAGLFLLDRHHSADQSHLARAFTGGAGDSLLLVARRKLMLEGHLLLHSSWNGPLWAGALVFLWLQRRPRQHEDRAVIAGITVGAIASLLCNDSGLTAATWILLYGCGWSFVTVSPDEPASGPADTQPAST